MGNFLGEEDVATASIDNPNIAALPGSSNKSSSSKCPFFMPYQQFVTRLEYKNNERVERAFAEKIWNSVCEETYRKWKPDAGISAETKGRALAKAAAQV